MKAIRNRGSEETELFEGVGKGIDSEMSKSVEDISDLRIHDHSRIR